MVGIVTSPGSVARWRAGCLTAVLVAAVAVAGFWPDSGEATFPGRNGLIAFGPFGERDLCGPEIDCSGRYIEVAFPQRPASRRALTCREARCIAWEPAWSPDGRKLAFSNERGIAVARAHGSGRRRVTTRGSRAAWSPDGRRLVFDADATPRRGGFPVDTDDLFVKRLGHGTRRLTYRGGDSAAWSSRGQIAFVRRSPRGFRFDVHLWLGPGRGVRRLTGGGQSEAPSWSPDGTRLAVVRYGRKAGQNIVIIDPRSRRARTVTRLGGSHPVWSPDGRRILFHRGESLFSVNPRGGALKREVRSVGQLVSGIDWQPRKR